MQVRAVGLCLTRNLSDLGFSVWRNLSSIRSTWYETRRGADTISLPNSFHSPVFSLESRKGPQEKHDQGIMAPASYPKHHPTISSTCSVSASRTTQAVPDSSCGDGTLTREDRKAECVLAYCKLKYGAASRHILLHLDSISTGGR